VKKAPIQLPDNAKEWIVQYGPWLTLVILVLTLPGLFARKMSGWTLLFYARLVSLVATVLSAAVVSALLVALISLYVLFQVRPLYKA